MRFQRLHVFDLGLFWFESVSCSETKAQPFSVSLSSVCLSVQIVCGVYVGLLKCKHYPRNNNVTIVYIITTSAKLLLRQSTHGSLTDITVSKHLLIM